jgi:hypothetical protein
VREFNLLEGRWSKTDWGKPSKESKCKFLNSLQ